MDALVTGYVLWSAMDALVTGYVECYDALVTGYVLWSAMDALVTGYYIECYGRSGNWVCRVLWTLW